MKKVVIIGAGISGLFLANILKKDSNFDISIYEKNNSINLEKGYGIQLSVNSIRLLNEIGFQAINKLNIFNPNKVDFYSLRNNKKICDLDISMFNDSDAKYTTLSRSTLIQFLKKNISKNLINYNKEVTKINQHFNNIELSFNDRTSIECDYLILSDGVFSPTKSLIVKKEIKPKYFKSIALRASVDKSFYQEINPKNISLFLGSNLHSVLYPTNNSSELNFVSLLRKDLSNEEIYNYTLFKDKIFVSSILSEISNQIDPNILQNLKNIKCFPVFVSKEVHDLKIKNIFIIGDAFFTFPPTFAQGASQSIEVAFELYKNIQSRSNQFNFQRIKRTKMINKKSRFNYFAFHLSNSLMIFIRDFLMKYLLKNKKFISSYLGSIYKN